MNERGSQRALRLDRRPDGVAVVTFDTPGSPVNIVSSTLFGEFGGLLDEIDADGEIRAVVFASGKADSFVAGADLKEFFAIRLPIEGERFSREGHALLDRIARSTRPFVAAIHGAALGGGLEIALACHARVASDDPRTVLALPEVTLGLLPGGGGTQRLPRLVGLRRALPVVLGARRVRARDALRWGLVDALVPPFDIVDRAAVAALGLAAGTWRPRRPSRGLVDSILELPIVRSWVVGRARADVSRRTRGNYPAPMLALSCVESGLEQGERAGLELESSGFGRLTASPEAKALIGLFLATTELKRPRGEAEPRTVARAGVLGAGLMGAGIAAAAVDLVPVAMRDVTLEALGRGVRQISEGLEHRVRSGSLSRLEADRRRSRLYPTLDLADLARADLVVEAVFEELELKRRVVADLERVVADDAVIASNTSAIPIREIAARAERPDRIVGMHYFSPVHKMQLLEVVRPPEAAEWAVATARAFGVAQKKSVIVVKDGPGFYTTRILSPYLHEATLLVAEGADVATIDGALERFGFPVGPLALVDEVGVDVGAHVSEFLGAAFAARGLEPHDLLRRMAEAGMLGRKSGHGFYVYERGRKKGGRRVNEGAKVFFGRREGPPVDEREIADRLALLMVNEAIYCLQEEIVASPLDGDVGAVLGLGFPPFRGGPFRYVDHVGAARVVDDLESLARRLGPRFLPAPLLVEMARESTRFYGAAER